MAKPKPNAALIAWIELRSEEDLFLSAITMGELEKGIAKLPASHRRTELVEWVHNDLRDRFQDRVLTIDTTVAVRWGSIAGASEAKGQALPVIDCLLSATALHHGLIIATRNIEDFTRCGARCVNPWLE